MAALWPTKFCGIDVVPCGGDQMALCYRAFDHWQKHDHADECEHDSVLDCITAYAAWYSEPDSSATPS